MPSTGTWRNMRAPGEDSRQGSRSQSTTLYKYGHTTYCTASLRGHTPLRRVFTDCPLPSCTGTIPRLLVGGLLRVLTVGFGDSDAAMLELGPIHDVRTLVMFAPGAAGATAVACYSRPHRVLSVAHYRRPITSDTYH